MNITVQGINLHYEITGDGPPLLLLHGWGCDSSTVASIARSIADRRRVLSLDFPGFGGSDAPPQPWSVSEYCDCLVAFLREIGWPPCDIIAHSFGGRVTILLAAEHPSLVKRIILTGGAGLIPKRGLRYHIKVWTYKLGKRAAAIGWLSALLRVLGIDLQKRAQKAGSDDYRALSGVMRATFVRVVNQDLRAYLKCIRASVLLIWGENDDQTPLWMAQTMEREIADCGLVVFEGAGHYAFLEQPARFAAVVRAFLPG